jgi:transcriptional regulator with XRE-family HTH domain
MIIRPGAQDCQEEADFGLVSRGLVMVDGRVMQGGTEHGRLREARFKAGLSQRALGEAVGFDQAYVSRVERGVQRPSFAYLSAVVRVLDLWPVVDMLDELWRPAAGQPVGKSKRGQRRFQSRPSPRPRLAEEES